MILEFICFRNWDQSLLDDVIAWLREDFPLKINAPGGMVEYREALAASFFFKFFIYVKQCLAKDGVNEVSCGGAELACISLLCW